MKCSGTRQEWEIGEEPCGNCAGIGRDLKSDLWSESCGYCRGTKRVSFCRRSPTCQVCGGTDTIQY